MRVRREASGWSGGGDDRQPAAEERHDAIVARSGPGCGPKAMSARRCSSSSANVSPLDGLDRDLDALVAGRERVTSGPTCSATTGVAATWMRRGWPGESWTERRACSARPRISPARAASRRPPAVSAMPRPSRTKSSSPSSLRSAATATDTAGSVTSSSAAAAFTEPRRATRTKDCSWRASSQGHLSDRLTPFDRITVTAARCSLEERQGGGHAGSRTVRVRAGGQRRRGARAARAARPRGAPPGGRALACCR